MCKYFLFNIPNAAAFFGIKRFKVVFVFKYKSHDEINYNGASKREKGKIDKVHAYRGGADAELFSPPFTYAKRFVFKPLNDFVDHDKQIYI
jgi:hypothetical protein